MSLRDDLDEQGYFELPPTLSPVLIERARRDIEAHAEAVDAFVDDALWDILDAVLPIAREVLRHDVVTLPAVWAWRVAPGETGWGIHRDDPTKARDAAGDLGALTLWIPLTDATTRNGCIHCLPACWDHGYLSERGGDIVGSVRHIRALPAAAGSVLGWSHSLLHWGGACAPGEPPRIATSFEVMRSDLATTVPRTYPVGWRPSASERVALIAEMRVKYQHMLTG